MLTAWHFACRPCCLITCLRWTLLFHPSHLTQRWFYCPYRSSTCSTESIHNVDNFMFKTVYYENLVNYFRNVSMFDSHDVLSVSHRLRYSLGWLLKLQTNQVLLQLFVCYLNVALYPKVYQSSKPLRIGYYENDGYQHPSPSMLRGVREVKALLERAGHTVRVTRYSEPNLWSSSPTMCYCAALAQNLGWNPKHWKGRSYIKCFGFVNRSKVWFVREVPTYHFTVNLDFVIFPNIKSTWEQNSISNCALYPQLCSSRLSAYAISVSPQFVAFKPLKMEYAMNDLIIKAFFSDGSSTLLKALWVHHIKQGYQQLVQNWPIIVIQKI